MAINNVNRHNNKNKCFICMLHILYTIKSKNTQIKKPWNNCIYNCILYAYAACKVYSFCIY